MSNLPRDLVEEILSRVPVKYRRAVRFTCKTWNTLTKDDSFVKKHVGQAKLASAKTKEFMVIMTMGFRVYLTSVNLHSNVIKHEAKFTSLDDSDVLDVVRVIHCDGLLLYITKGSSKLVVWNPYCGQPRWIEFEPSFNRTGIYLYALGYEKHINCCDSHKILRFSNFFYKLKEFKIYDFNSDKWRVLDVTPDEKIRIPYHSRGVSLKGNTYWFAETRDGHDCLILSFDFTRERFWLPLSMPFKYWKPEDLVTLSSVRDEQLAVLHQRSDTFMMEFWITTKIEPNMVSWNTKLFLAVNMVRPHSHFGLGFTFMSLSFFINEEKKAALVFSKDQGVSPTRDIAYIVGMDGTLKEAYLCVHEKYRYPLACSYVPSLVQL
ncbi:putative F-box protein At3g23420 [Capsella rubella]|nr:putative F-box protein At3g23420 [Capsella rubella]